MERSPAPLSEVRVLDPGDGVVGGRLDTAAPTLVRLLAAPRPNDGEPVTLEAQVLTVHAQGRPPTGTVAFRAGHRLLGAAPVDVAGRAVLDGILLPAGVHPVVATYGGDGWHAPATSAPVPQVVVARAAPVVVALAVPQCSSLGVVLSAQLLDAATGRTVEGVQGAITFALDGAELGSAQLVEGEATLVLTALAVGRITARFQGDLEHAAAEGTAEGLAP